MTTLVVLHSGGLDSSTALVWATEMTPSVVSFGVDYGQRHKRELEYAQRLADRLGIPRVVVSAPIGFGKSALLGEMPVPEGHYAEATMSRTVVPNRNMVMIALAVSYAESIGAGSVITAVHSGDHFIYPDCRPEFVSSLGDAIWAATEKRVRLIAPFLFSTKRDIVRKGVETDLPFELTWSCYEGGEKHCGRCSTCVERIEAFYHAGVVDPTEYEAGTSYAEQVLREWAEGGRSRCL